MLYYLCIEYHLIFLLQDILHVKYTGNLSYIVCHISSYTVSVIIYGTKCCLMLYHDIGLCYLIVVNHGISKTDLYSLCYIVMVTLE